MESNYSRDARLQQLQQRKKECIAQKDWAGAIDVLHQIVELSPSTASYNQCGLLLLQLERYVEALSCFEQALAINPDSRQAHEGMAQAKAQMHALKTVQMKKILQDIDATDETAELPPTFGRYQLRGKLGQGGMGVVYRAYDTELRREVALKTILSASDQTLVKRFTKEAEAMAKLVHPGLVKIYDVGKVDGRPYLTMEFIEGRPLSKVLKQEKMSSRHAAEIVSKVTQAISYAHSKGILHRDIKPSNIMIDQQGEPKVMDFGLALDVANEAKLSLTGVAVGTPAYMSPEQTLGKRKEIDERSDVYSLGVLLYEMLVGAPPFRGMNGPIAVEVLERDPVPPCQLSPRIPRDISNICLKAVAKAKKDRYQSAAAMAEDLQRFIGRETVLAHGPTVAYRLKNLLRKKPYMLTAALVLLAIAIALSAIYRRPDGQCGERKIIDKTSPFSEQVNHDSGQNARQVERLMRELGVGTPERGIVDRCITEIVRMKSAETVSKLLTYLYSPNVWQRRVAIETLGKIGDTASKLDGRDVVDWMMARLKSLDLRNPEELQEAHDAIWALGRLGDGRAFTLVSEVRRTAGENSVFWENTKIPHSWLPMTPTQIATTAAEYDRHGTMREEQGDMQGAIAAFSMALQEDSRYAPAYNNRGKVRAAQGDFAGALADFNKAIEIDPTNAKVYNNRGIVWQMQGDFNRALADFNKAIALQPQMAEAYINRAGFRLQRGDMMGTIADAGKAIQLDPQAVNAYDKRAHARMVLGDKAGALADANKALEINPQHADSYLTRGNVRAGNKEYDGAINDYSKAISLKPQDANAYFNRGNARDSKGDRDGAIVDFSKAIQLRADFAEAYTNRGSSYFSKGDIDKAIADYNKAIEIDPQNAEPYVNRAIARHSQGDWEAEMNDYNAAIRIEPGFAKAYHNRGMLWSEKNEPVNAIADFTKAIEINPRQGQSYKMRGNQLMKQGNHEEAAADLMRYIHLQPDDPDIYNYVDYIKKHRKTSPKNQ